MSFQAFLRWVGITDPERFQHQTGMSMVKDAMATLRSQNSEQSRELLAALEPIHQHFLDGGIPAKELTEFYVKFEHLIERKELIPAGIQLENKLRQRAEDLPEELWCTQAYLDLEDGVQRFLDGEPEPLDRVLETMESTMEQAWKQYFETPIVESEVTAESVVGHALLQEGIEEWRVALNLIAQAASAAWAEEASEPNAEDTEREEESEEELSSWEEALATAQYANRLLVAVQDFSERI